MAYQIMSIIYAFIIESLSANDWDTFTCVPTTAIKYNFIRRS